VKALLALAMSVLVAATSSECSAPGDKGQPPAPDAPGTIELVIEVVSHPSEKQVLVKLDAVDHAGLPTVNLEYGELYPTSHIERTTYKHIIVHPPSATVTYSVDALMAGEGGDLLGCNMYLNGVKLMGPGNVAVYSIPESLDVGEVWCEFTYYGGTS